MVAVKFMREYGSARLRDYIAARTGDNLHVRKSGVRVCLTCRRRLAREQYARRMRTVA